MMRSAPLSLLLGLSLPLSAQAPAPAAQVPDEPAAILSGAQAQGQALLKAKAAFLEAGGSSAEFKPAVAGDLAALAARLQGEKRPAVRQALILSQLYLLRLARQVPSPDLLLMTFNELPATHPGWAMDKSLLLALGTWAPEAAQPYLAKARAGFPDPAVRVNLLFEHFVVSIDTAPESVWRPAYDALVKDFPGSPEAAKAGERLASEVKTAVGVATPPFAVADLLDPRLTYTVASFKGHYLLLDFWATWCPDCAAEMPTLHKAYARFASKGLEILSLSFDRRKEHIAPYRMRAATPMPWKHAFLDGAFKNPLSEAYGVKSIPKPVLVGPDGKIVANGGDLHGDNLEKTLEKFLGK